MTLKNYLLSTNCVHVKHLNSKGSVITVVFLHTLRVWFFLFKRVTDDRATGYNWVIGIGALELLNALYLYFGVLRKVVWHLDGELKNVINVSEVIKNAVLGRSSFTFSIHALCNVGYCIKRLNPLQLWELCCLFLLTADLSKIPGIAFCYVT